ncbi:MAG: ATP-binding protein [Pseudomonadota bacterium]
MTDQTIAPLKNVGLFAGLMNQLVSRPAHLPGLGIFHGHSGLGKTFAATYAAHKNRALYVEVGASWGQKKFLERLLRECGVAKPRGTIADMVEQVIDRLDRPLIIDEMDAVVARKYWEIVREIHDKTRTPIVMIGEEWLPKKLEATADRFNNRILAWVAAVPADVADAKHLARLYAPDVVFEDDVLAEIVKATRGRARLICNNIYQVSQARLAVGKKTAALADVDAARFHTGFAPGERVA